MSIFKKIISLIYDKNPIVHSKITSVFTKYGLFQAQVYQDEDAQYLVIMSKDFFDLDFPIVYIHSNFHQHDDFETNIRHLRGEISSVLKLIDKEGGMMIYHSKDGNNIEELLKKLNVRKLQNEENSLSKIKAPLSLKLQRREYQVLGAIFKNLNLNAINLISHDINLTVVLEQLQIDILKREEVISFRYGD